MLDPLIFSDLNPLAILACAFFNMFLGMVWYSPRVFGRVWMESLGINLNDIADSGVQVRLAYFAALFSAVLLSYGLAVAVRALDLRGFFVGTLLGGLVWLFFNFTSMLKIRFFEDRPLRLFLLNSGYDLLSYAVIGGILSEFR